VTVQLTLNGQTVSVDVDPRLSLLAALRDHLEHPGSKNACEQGECGSCSVFLDGDLVCSCLVAVGQVQGRELVTVEGIGGTEPHQVQQAFVDAGAVQCGFCTPGLVMATANLLTEIPHPTEDQVREALSGNLCRCTGYQKILDAVKLAATNLSDGRNRDD
jgi:carbon-monoxide dehydrogenase small subunit